MFNPNQVTDKSGVFEIKNSIEDENKESIEYSDQNNYKMKYTTEEFFKLQKGYNSDAQLFLIDDIRPISSGGVLRSHLPVVHNVILKFEDDPVTAVLIFRREVIVKS
jgi:hypothetical protein